MRLFGSRSDYSPDQMEQRPPSPWPSPPGEGTASRVAGYSDTRRANTVARDLHGDGE